MEPPSFVTSRCPFPSQTLSRSRPARVQPKTLTKRLRAHSSRPRLTPPQLLLPLEPCRLLGRDRGTVVEECALVRYISLVYSLQIEWFHMPGRVRFVAPIGKIRCSWI